MRNKIRSGILILVLALQVLFYGSLSTASASLCEGLFENSGGAAVELEMGTSRPVLNLLTTSDGLVGGLIPAGKLPKDYMVWAKAFYPGMDPRLIEWDLLPDNLKRELLVYVSVNKKTSFFEDRYVPNVKVKDIIHVKFDSETLFLGERYSAGEYDIDMSPFFGRVEYMGPMTVKEFTGVELHLRSADLEAGHLLESAWKLQEGIGAKKTHFHQHIVNPLPMASLASKPVETSLVLTEYYRRANLLAEFISVLKGEGIRANKRSTLLSTITYFDSITPKFLSGIFDYFANGVREGKKIETDFKMGWVGFRGSDAYDQPNLYGFEYRAISRNDDAALFGKLLTNMQDGMRTERYGFTEDSITAWVKEKGVKLDEPAQVEKVLETTWYKQSYKTLMKRLPEYLKPSLGGPILRFLYVSMMKWSSSGNQAVKMLLYDWASDPLFRSDPEGQRKVIEAQIKAIERYTKNGHSLNRISKDFVKSSGLLEKVGQTFGLEMADFEVLNPKPQLPPQPTH